MFPSELLQYPNWVCWRNTLTQDGKPTKLPFNPRTGYLASVTDPSSWSDYNTAYYAATGSNYSGIGFVLSANDPFAIIDLDDPFDPKHKYTPEVANAILQRQIAIANAFDTYSEISPSGRGLHIIIKGEMPYGSRRDCIEAYSRERYFTMTGATYHDKPIAERQFLLLRLWEELTSNKKKNQTPIIESPQVYDDEFIFRRACEAENGEKFEALWNGNYHRYYPSQSEADFALINILSFYSRNVEQIKRMFHYSALGKRDKAKRVNYVEGMIRRSFDNQPPAIPLEELTAKLQRDLEEKRKQQAQPQVQIEKPTVLNPFAGPLFAEVEAPNYDWTCPPGLLGDIAQFIYASAPRPVKEIALAAAIGLLAGICGRAYNVSGTGLNQYVLVLAKTGVGKEAVSSGIDKLMNAVKMSVPAALEFLGPEEIASGSALTKHLVKHPCFVSLVGEFGLLLQQICSPNANLSQIQLRRTLLKLYNKSGAEDVQRGTIYSDKEKNTQPIKSPAFSMLGESTPETFYGALDESMIAQGLLPRFTCVEYGGDRPPLNKNHKETVPSEQLVQRVGELAAQCLLLAQHDRRIEVRLDVEGQSYLDAFNAKCDLKINSSEAEVARQLWNRAHIKALKLGALIAIGLSPYDPVITLEAAQWAQMLVERDVLNILEKFATGKAGKDTNELNQLNDVIYYIKDYMRRPYKDIETYNVMPQMHADRVLPLAYLQRRLFCKNSFKLDRQGATGALKRALEALIAEGSIRQIRELDAYNRYGKTMKCFIIVDVARFV